MPLRNNVGMAQGGLEREFLPSPFFIIRELVQHLNALCEICDRFQIRRQRACPFAGTAPVVDGARRVARFGVVMRHQFRVRCNRVSEALLHQRRDLKVILLPGALQE